ncbi:MAG: acyl-ACP--UDP-N-acetylglucosamine O-acyltransferase [Planctomycetota bacterium]|nr:MAG: acyl-ACP--UDP-N-acetylglucosamine O-acyltransferase [Planctomycetota bacterium]
MSQIHPTAFVDPRAELGANVCVGAFAYVGPEVVIGDDCVIHPHATVLGPSVFGRGNQVFPQATLGAAPQDLKYKGGPTRLEIGDNNIFRENVTVHRGTEVDRTSSGRTRIGNRNLFMCGVHVAHDSEVGDHVILANNVLVAGHVRIENCVTIGGASAMHHFTTIGRNAYVGGMTRITHDVPPYVKVQGYDQEVRGVNTEGMRRWRIDADSISAVKQAFRLIFPRRGDRSLGRTAEAIREIEQNGLIDDEHVRYLVEFLRRKIEIGVYGRVREALRSDADRDREAFYSASSKTQAPS